MWNSGVSTAFRTRSCDDCRMQRGRRLGVYELVEELGAGGMGVVWRAHDRRLGRDVALKILPPHLGAHPDALVRFEREARGLAALSHPNIISIFDLGDEGELRFIVTELLSGETLRQALKRGPMPWRTAAEICATIADGLAAAHAKGIVHRDLKPENIFLTSDGRVKILDFGLAKEVVMPDVNATTVAHQTEPGHVLGTLGYTSPEQLRGEEANLASDLFSLGCVLFEMLTGRPAFLRDTAADTIAAILTAEPPELHTLSQTPQDLSRIVKRCIDKRPAARFQSASDLAFALRELTVTRTAEIATTPRRRWSIAVAIVVLVLIVGGFFASKYIRRPASQEPFSLAVVPFTADAERAYAGEGIAESLFRSLAPSMRVVSRKVAAPGDATHVLRGSVRNDGITAEIVDMSSGRVIWSRNYQGGDLLRLESHIAADVTAFLERRDLSASSDVTPARGATVDAEAYREYLKGRHYWNKLTLDGFTKAREHFEKSIDLDPTYALAYSGLSDAYAMLAFHGGNAAELMPKARAAASRAIELDPQLGEGYTSLGTVLMLHAWDWNGAERALRRGVELNPRYATAHHAYAVYLGIVGRTDEALREIQTASELDPLSLVIYIDVAWIHYSRNEMAETIENIERAIRHDPRSAFARYESIWYFDHTGRYAEAIDALETALRLEQRDVAPARELRAALERGGARGYLRRKHELAEAAGESQATLATISVLLGDTERALDEVEEAVKRHERDAIYFKTSPSYAALRGQPRFQKVLETMGF